MRMHVWECMCACLCCKCPNVYKRMIGSDIAYNSAVYYRQKLINRISRTNTPLLIWRKGGEVVSVII